MKEVQTLPGRELSPASLVRKIADGALLVSIEPKIYDDQLGCSVVYDEQGNTFSQTYQIIAFRLGGVRYYTIWGARFGDSPPATLVRKKKYRFLVRPRTVGRPTDDSDVPCEIIKVWDGEKLIVDKPSASSTNSPE